MMTPASSRFRPTRAKDPVQNNVAMRGVEASGWQGARRANSRSIQLDELRESRRHAGLGNLSDLLAEVGTVIRGSLTPVGVADEGLGRSLRRDLGLDWRLALRTRHARHEWPHALSLCAGSEVVRSLPDIALRRPLDGRHFF